MICAAHWDRIRLRVPAYQLGLCADCFRGLPIRPQENLGANLSTAIREKAAAASRARYALNREKAATVNRAWYALNREKAAAVKRAWYALNREKAAAASRAWYARSREKGIYERS